MPQSGELTWRAPPTVAATTTEPSLSETYRTRCTPRRSKARPPLTLPKRVKAARAPRHTGTKCRVRVSADRRHRMEFGHFSARLCLTRCLTLCPRGGFCCKMGGQDVLIGKSSKFMIGRWVAWPAWLDSLQAGINAMLWPTNFCALRRVSF